MPKLTKFQSQRINRIRQQVLNNTVIMGWRHLNPDDGGTSQFCFKEALTAASIRKCLDTNCSDEVTDEINKFGAVLYADSLYTAFKGKTLEDKTNEWMRLISENPRRWRITVAYQAKIKLTGETYSTVQVMETGNAKHSDIVEAVGLEFGKLRDSMNSQHEKSILLWFSHPVVNGVTMPDFDELIKEANNLEL